MRALAGLLFVVSTSSGLLAFEGPGVDIPGRARGAQRVIVGRVVHVQASFTRNSFGDQLIVSRATVAVEETLKGANTALTVPVEVEGGTVGDLTLRVSDMPAVKSGDRAIFFLNEGQGGVHVPHMRGHGILELDSSERVHGTTLTLPEVRRLVRQSQK